MWGIWEIHTSHSSVAYTVNSVSVNGEFEESLSKTYVQHSAPARKNEV